MSRRTTLGAITSGQLNSRASMGPERVAREGPGALGTSAGPPRAGRKSILPSSMPLGPVSSASLGAGLTDVRRSSAFNSNKAAGPRADPRPLNDKAYQASCARTIITYLSTHNYPASVSPKTLASPTGKDFQQIVQFLFCKLDPNLSKLGKIEEEVPLLFKRLNYPFQISRSALFAVGSLHSWPPVLAALTWLTELLNYNERADKQPAASFHDGLDRREARFFECSSSSYKYYMAGDDARVQECDQKMFADFQDQERVILDQRKAVQEAHAEVRAELEALRNSPDPLAVAQTCLAEQRAHEHKFVTLIDQFQNQKAAAERKLHERQADLNSRQEQLAAAGKEHEALRLRVASQTVNKADLNRMIMERTKHKDVLEAMSSQVEVAEKAQLEQESQIMKSLSSLEASAQVYNSMAHSLKLVPATAKHAGGITFELRLNCDPASPLDLANLDLKGVIKPALERLVEQNRRQALEFARDLSGLREEAAAAADHLHERLEENSALEQQITQMEAQLRVAREHLDAQVRVATEQAERVKGEVAVLRNAASGRAADIEERRAAVLQEYDVLQRKLAAEATQMRSDMRRAVDLLVAHGDHVQRCVHKASTAMLQVQQQVSATSLPTVPADFSHLLGPA